MNRRSFISSIIAAISMPAVVKAALGKPGSPIELPKIACKPSTARDCTLTRAMITPLSPSDILMLDEIHVLYNGPKWIQVKRSTHIPFPQGVSSWDEFRLKLARERLGRQLAMPTPNLP